MLSNYQISLLLIIFCIIALFCKITLEYIYNRYKERKMLLNDDDDDDDDEQYYDVKEWLNKNANSNQTDDKNNELCKDMVIEVDDNVDNCTHISRNLCGIVTMKKITIPSNSKIDFYSESGVKLVAGKSYCVYKPPPPFFNNNNCNKSWGFWQYSLKNEQWQSKSKVPGIYNSNTNRFDPCSKGELLFNNKLLPNDKILRLASPVFFLSEISEKNYV